MAKRKKIDLDDGDYSDETLNTKVKKKTRKTVDKTRQRSTKKLQVQNSDDEFSGNSSDPGVTVISSPHTPSLHVVSEPISMGKSLLEWFAGVRETRCMPWRKPYNPEHSPVERAQRAYEVWISEIMLQQTQVATVVPYYNNWMAKFPTIQDLAASDIETVNSLWKGLGYYSRAARLLQGAKTAVTEYNGRLPDNAKDMEAKVPGIGRYSAGAICSIAYNHRVPVLDGNVHRLLSRVLALHAPPKAKPTLDVLWGGATALVQATDQPGDLNQALIELGSTVCKCAHESTPTAIVSSCDMPDIEEICTICEPGPTLESVTAYPMKAERKKAREELDSVNVIEWRCRESDERWFLLVRRPEKGLLAGLHEFPTLPNIPATTSHASLAEVPLVLMTDILASPPHSSKPLPTLRASPASPSASTVKITTIRPAGDVIHVFSHIRKTYRVQWVLLEGGSTPPPLLAHPPSSGDIKKRKSAAKRSVIVKGKQRVRATTANTDAVSTPLEASWIPINEIADANISTGVLKVWKQVCALWDVESD